jgi:acyl-CoA reductase-like NAD-dependent aldehyde dehydrogenase
VGAVAPPGSAPIEEPVVNPATLKPIASVAIATAADAEAALRAARGARPPWLEAGRSGRGSALHEVARTIRSRAAELASLASQESGRACRETRLATEAAAAFFERHAYGATDAALPAAAADHTAVGPDAVIVSIGRDCTLEDWARVAAPVLARGWPLISLVPASASCTMGAISSNDACVIPGVLQCLRVASADWPKLPANADGALQLRVEPGGVGPSDAPATEPGEREVCLIAADADLEVAVTEAARSRLRDSGQLPSTCAQVFVDVSVVDRATDRLHEFMALLEAGDPVKPATELGPLRHAARMREVEDLVAQVLRLKLRLILGGLRYQPWGLRGYFFQPTLLVADHGPDARLPEYIPGPVVILTPVRGLGEFAAHIGERGGSHGGRVRVRLFSAKAEAGRREILAAGVPGLVVDAGDARP